MYSLFAVPPAIFIVATVVVLVWDMFCMVSEVALLDAVAKVCPLPRVVSVEYSVDFTDHATLLIAVSYTHLTLPTKA